MNRFARLYHDVEADARWVVVGAAWCVTDAVPMGERTLQLIADCGCAVYLVSLS